MTQEELEFCNKMFPIYCKNELYYLYNDNFCFLSKQKALQIQKLLYDVYMLGVNNR